MAKKIQMPIVERNKKPTKGRELVYQGNPLIQSRKYFTTIGTRLFILGLMTLNPHLSKNDKFFDSEFPHVLVSTSELTKLFENTTYLNKLKTECEKLFNSSITLDYTDTSFTLAHIFNVMEYKSGEGLYIQFDPKMKEYLLDLVNGGYTAMNIEQIFKLTSTYAVRLIELCLQYRNMTKGSVIERKLTIEKIRFYLNVPDDAYVGRINNFKQKVLDEPIEEIEKKTDFRMSYHTEKEGRCIKYFVFKLDISRIPEKVFDIKAECVEKLPVSAPFDDVLAELVAQGFSRKAAENILAKVDDTVEVGLRLEYALKILPAYHKKNPIKNKQGFLTNAIIEDWRKNDVKSKNSMNISDASKAKNNMKLNNLDGEKAHIQQQVDDANAAMQKTGITQADLQGDEKPIPATMAKSIAKAVLENNLSEGAKNLLQTFHFTPERFQQVYLENETFVNSLETEFTNTGVFKSLLDSFAFAG